MPPRITGDELTAKTAYGADQTGAVVYATTAASPAGQTVNVTSPGLYYFDGTVWVGIVNNENKVAGKCIAIGSTFPVGDNGTQVIVGDYGFRFYNRTENSWTANHFEIIKNDTSSNPTTTEMISKPLGGQNFAQQYSFVELPPNTWTRISDGLDINSEHMGQIIIHTEDNRVFTITASTLRRRGGSNNDGRVCYTVEQLN